MSTLKVNSIEPANAGQEDFYLAKAWVNFDGTGTVAIRDGGNVSSITDNGEGNYTINFTNAFSSSNYSGFHLSGSLGSGSYHLVSPHTVTTSSLRVNGAGPSGNPVDRDFVTIGVLL